MLPPHRMVPFGLEVMEIVGDGDVPMQMEFEEMQPFAAVPHAV